MRRGRPSSEIVTRSRAPSLRPLHRRRSRSTIAVVISVFMVAGAISFVLAPAEAAPASRGTGNGPAVCGCTCYGTCGGECPSGSSLGLGLYSLSVNPTNATLSWDTTGSGGITAVSANITFGTTTAYSFYAGNDTTQYQDVYINYLEPSTEYHYKIAGFGYCVYEDVYHWYRGTYAGTFNTSAETVYTVNQILYISGHVQNSTGSPGPSGMLVIAYCSDWVGTWTDMEYNLTGLTSSISSEWWQSATVGSNGDFRIPVSTFLTNSSNGYAEVCDWGGAQTIITIFTTTSEHCGYLNYCVSGAGWGGLGAWNETYVVWDRPFLHADAPTNQLGPYVPLELEFTNSTYATLQFNESVSVSTTYTDIVAGTGEEGSSSFAVDQTGSATGEDVETWVQYYTSGFVTFNATERNSSLSYVTFSGPKYHSTTQNLITGIPLSPASIPRDETYDDGLWDWYNITPTETRGGSVTISGSATDITGLDISVDLSLDLGGVASVGVSIPIDVTFSTTTSYADAFSFSVDNTGSADHAFTAYVAGGSNTESGMVVYVWQDD